MHTFQTFLKCRTEILLKLDPDQHQPKIESWKQKVNFFLGEWRSFLTDAPSTGMILP
jgi:hypothetical protein